MKKPLTALLILSILLLGGCVKTNNNTEKITSKCIALCKEVKTNINTSNGPCLSNNISDGWVCDMAHQPREEIDNRPENQCEAFRNGSAKHFVEVDEQCNFIRAT